MDNPCKNCSRRHIGCHSSCMSYGKWKDERDAMRKQRIKEYNDYDFLKTVKYGRNRRNG